MSIFKKIAGFSGVLALAPLFAQAQDTDNLVALFEQLGNIVGLLIPIAFAAILLFFFWGLAKYMFGDAEDKEKGRNLMIWGVIALFVAASIWGLVAFLRDVFGVTDEVAGVNPVVNENNTFTF